MPLPRLPLPLPARFTGRTAGRRTAEHPDLRPVAPQLGRTPQPQDLLDHARGLVVEAMRDEFFREGLMLVDLPEDWTRRTLLEAGIPEDAEYTAFVHRSLYAMDLQAPAQPLAHVRQLLSSPAAQDRVGLTLEAAGALVRLLVHEAVKRRGGGETQEAREIETLRSCAQGQLRRMVTVPQELRVAQQRLAAVEAMAERTRGTAAGTAAHPAPEDGGDHSARSEEGPTSPSGGGATASSETAGSSDRPTLSQRAGAVRDFLDSDTGRWTVDLLTRGAAAAASVPAVREAGARVVQAAAEQARRGRRSAL